MNRLHRANSKISHEVNHSGIARSVARLWKNSELCDCILVSSQQDSFPAHKVVLAAASQYFKVLFLGAGQHMLSSMAKGDQGTDVVQLDVPVDSNSVELVLQAIYYEEFVVEEKNVEQLLSAASYLQIDSVLDSCSEFLAHQGCCPELCIWTMTLAEHYSLKEIFHTALTVAASTPYELLQGRHRQDIMALSKDSLQSLLHTTYFRGVQIFQAVLLWADADPAARGMHVKQLCNHVPAARMLSVRHREDLLQLPCTPAVKAAVAEWVEEIQRESAATTADDSSCMPADVTRQQPCAQGQLLIAGGHDVAWQSLRSVELYDIREDKWSRGTPMPHRESFAGCAAVGDQVALLGGGMHGRSMTVYSLATQSWQAAEAPHSPHLHCAVASLQDSLFVLGGRAGNGAGSELRSVECCRSICAGAASELAGPTPVDWLYTSNMTVARTCLAAASLGDTLYAIGGQAGRQIWNTVEAYNAHHDAWVQLPGHMRTERKYTSAGILHGRLYVAGGMTSTRTRLESVEAYDPREGKWSWVAAMGVPRSSAGVAALADCLFAVGGNAGDDWIHSSVEMYIPAAGRWLQRAPIAHARSGLAIAAL
ncbi:hypothetical protein ABBQ38_15519 [Trebouxia sp. C0009 RCD-2024]